MRRPSLAVWCALQLSWYRAANAPWRVRHQEGSCRARCLGSFWYPVVVGKRWKILLVLNLLTAWGYFQEKVFSFIQHNAVVLLDDICKEGSSKRYLLCLVSDWRYDLSLLCCRRLVDEWTRNDETGVYSMTAECVDLVEYLKANGIGIIPVTRCICW